ncbi:MAG: low molecular weight protein-tyrosine-phosphatase [Paracoccaceae bacterium]
MSDGPKRDVRRVLCVCLGNICRSPLAEGVLAAKAAEAGLDLDVDSAGTGDWHVGEPPHSSSVAVARRRGYDIAGQRARQVEPADLDRFDLILAVDRSTLQALRRLAPADATARLRLLDEADGDVPDPYGSSLAAYEAVLDRIETAAARLVAALSEGRDRSIS